MSEGEKIMAKETGPTADERLQWQAEDIVREAIKKSPTFKKAVRQVKGELKQTHKRIAKKMGGKK